MIEMIIPYIRNMEARAIPPYQHFLKAQKTFILKKYERLNASQGHESPGIKLLRYILQFVDIDYLDSQSNNYDRYSYHLRFIRRDLMNIFDRVGRGRGYRHLFFNKNRFITEEFLLPIEDVNSIVNLPLYTDSWGVWKHVRPLRLWTHDSHEYTVNVLNDRVTFKTLPPSYAVELLDVVALVFKYYVWLKQQRHREPAKELATFIPQQLFLHKYVLDSWVWDLSNIWLLSCLNQVFSIEDREQLNAFDSYSLQTEQQYGWVSLQSRRGMESIWDLIYDSKRNLRPEALLSSKVLYGGSIHDRIELVDKKLTLPIHQQYEYLRWMRDKDLFKFFIQVWKARPELPTTKRMMINVRRDYERMLKRRPWQTCQNVLLKNSIEEEMTQTTNLFL